MTQDNETNECLDVRALVARRLDQGALSLQDDQSRTIEQHLSACLSCRQWQEQTKDLMSMASAMPQFDVSEALTQRILTAVEKERQTLVTTTQMVFMALVACAAFSCLSLDSAETATGLLSWFVGLAGVGLIKLLLDAAPASGKALKHQ